MSFSKWLVIQVGFRVLTKWIFRLMMKALFEGTESAESTCFENYWSKNFCCSASTTLYIAVAPP